MPPTIKINEEDIVTQAVAIVREKGIKALNARLLAHRLGCSTQPIFRVFSSMSELKERILLEAEKMYNYYVAEVVKESKSKNIPAYRCVGLGYIRFAKVESELFKFYFMRDRSEEDYARRIEDEDLEGSMASIQKATGCTKEQAYNFHISMWIFMHGLATMIVTSFLQFEDAEIDRLLSKQYDLMINDLKKK